MPDFFLLCGLPYSGKTYVRQRLQNLLENPQIISLDDYVLAYAKAHELTYQEAFSSYAGEAGKLIYSDLFKALKSQRPIIDDRSNLTIMSRQDRLSKIPKHYRKFAIICDAAKSIRDLRREARPEQLVPSNVIRQMEQSWVLPTTKEGFHAVLPMEQILHAKAA